MCHILQCEPPRDVEAYIHRSGRTGRAGRFKAVPVNIFLMLIFDFSILKY